MSMCIRCHRISRRIMWIISVSSFLVLVICISVCSVINIINSVVCMFSVSINSAFSQFVIL